MNPVSLSTTGRLLVTTFGLGALRPAPGTWGSMPPCAIAAALIVLSFGPNNGAQGFWAFNITLGLIVLIFSAACVRYGDAAEARFGKKDPGSVCADETAGMALALLFLPAAASSTLLRAAITLAAAFILFRLLDIFKPWPAHQLQTIPGGWGILIDDLVVGIQALIIIQLVAFLVF